ncbi:MAG: class I SAM-dependent methyltransferase [Pirellulaceae bacterium]
MNESALTVGEDQKTLDYFDNFTPHYNAERFRFAIDYLNKHGNAEQRLLDIGCGDGGTLALLKEHTAIVHLCGMDISANYLRKAERLLQCETIEGSILDDDLVAEHFEQFDYCTLGAVIHHLIGGTRRESLQFAVKCVENSFKLLKPGGSLIIFEPTYKPAWMMSAAFWIKKIVSRLSSKRVEMGRSWANLGQPIVSYYTAEQLTRFVEELPESRVLLNEVQDKLRLAGVIERQGMAVIVQKTDG